MKELESKDWFFLGGELYKKLAVDRSRNQIKAYNFAEQRPKMLMLSEVKKYKEPAFDARQVGLMLNRAKRTIYYYIEHEFILPSGKSDMPGGDGSAKWWFSPDDVIELRDIIEENSKNNYAPRPIPSREEVRAMTRTKRMLYVMEGGQYVPVYEAKTW